MLFRFIIFLPFTSTASIEVLLESVQPCNADLLDVQYIFYHDMSMIPSNLEFLPGCQKPTVFVKEDAYVMVSVSIKIYIFISISLLTIFISLS